jgi:hypothetical protein
MRNVRQLTDEAFTEVQPGGVLSSEKFIVCGGRPPPSTGKAIVMASDNGKFDVNPTESETTSTAGNFSHGSRETPAPSAAPMAADRSEKARSHNPDVYVAGESDSPIVPEKSANKGGVPSPAESMEGRGLTEENTEQTLLDRIQRRKRTGHRSCQVAWLARVYGKRARACLPLLSEVRAVCGKAARTDLCGGPPATAVPTALEKQKLCRNFLIDNKQRDHQIAILLPFFPVLFFCPLSFCHFCPGSHHSELVNLS